MPPTWQYAAVSRPQALGRQLCPGKRGVSNTSTLHPTATHVAALPRAPPWGDTGLWSRAPPLLSSEMTNKGMRAIRALGSCCAAPQPPIDVPGGPGTSAAAQGGLGEVLVARGVYVHREWAHGWPEMALRASINRHGPHSKNRTARQRLKVFDVMSNISEAQVLPPHNHREQAVRVSAVWPRDVHIGGWLWLHATAGTRTACSPWVLFTLGP